MELNEKNNFMFYKKKKKKKKKKKERIKKLSRKIKKRITLTSFLRLLVLFFVFIRMFFTVFTFI